MPPTSPTTVPTSFVPKQPVKTGGRFSQSGSNAILVIALFLLIASLVASAGVFFIDYYLKEESKKKSAEVAKTEAAISSETVTDFIRTRDRFVASKELLDRHVVSSAFFTLLDTVTLKTVRFNSLSLTVTDDRSGKISMEGAARTFNALAAQSSLLAQEKQIKRAIFSNITVTDDDTVTFTLEAEVDSGLLTLSAAEVTVSPEVPVATSTPVTATTTPAATTTQTAPTPPTTPLPLSPPTL